MVQYVHLSGFNSPSYDRVLENLTWANTAFQRTVREEFIEFLPVAIEKDYISFAARNKYFTPAWKAPNSHGESKEPIEEIDPKGILASIMAKNNLLHLDDNKVEYYRLENPTDLENQV